MSSQRGSIAPPAADSDDERAPSPNAADGEETAAALLSQVLRASHEQLDAEKEKEKEKEKKKKKKSRRNSDADALGDASDADPAEQPANSLGVPLPPPGLGASLSSSSINVNAAAASRNASLLANVNVDFTADLIPVTEETMSEIQMTLKTLAQIGNEESDQLNEVEGAMRDRELLLLVKSEYEKLQKLFMQGRKNEQELLNKCKDVTGQMMSNSVKVQAALKLSQNDRSTIASLKKEVKRAWKMVEAAGEKEQKAKDAIGRLKIEINKMRHGGMGSNSEGGADGDGDYDDDYAPADTGLDKMMGLQMEQEMQISNLTKEKGFLANQNDQLLTNVATLRSEITDLTNKLTTLNHEKQTTEKNLASIKELLAQKKADEDRTAKARDKLDATVKSLTDTLTKRDHDISMKISETKSLKEVISRLETMVKEDKLKAEKETMEKDKLFAKYNKLQTEYDQQHIDLTRLKSENQDQFMDLKTWETELTKYKEEFKAMVRLKDGLTKRIKMMEEAKMEAEVDRDNLRGQNLHVTYERDTMKKQIESNKKEIESLGRERDIAQKNFVRATGATQKQINSMKLADQTKRNLEQEISNYKEEASKMRKTEIDM
ncbi:hypothetical protein BDR26DRAFT_54248 [Obelidium mucronatum]|nr:hypothetical protein BDR26DRAFT_54248 [Obelidium mucronatum]